jgi:O-antigen biosynthesis protein
MVNVHLVSVFSRHGLLNTLLSLYRPMAIIWHLVQFQNEKLVVSAENWVQPFIIPKDFHPDLMIQANNYFIQNAEIVDEDYYAFAPDDDMYEPGVMDKIKQCTEDVVIISMKRGDHIPNDGTVPHGTDTLYACAENVRVNYIGGEQIFVKGHIFKKHLFVEDYYGADGLMAITLEERYNVRYEPRLFVLFNYFQPGRWDSKSSITNIIHSDNKPGLTSIVILTFNQLEYTKECVKSLHKHTPEPHEIVFVDNGSTDRTVKWMRKLTQENTNYKLIENKRNLGFSKGCNQGIEASHGEFVLLLNNDVVVADGWLTGLMDCLNYAPDAGIVGPMTNNISGLQQISSDEYHSVNDLDKYAALFREKHRYRRIPLRRIVGFAMFFKRKLTDQIGMLDESFGTGNFEDDDFCLRSELAGYKNYIAGDIFIHHFGSRSFIGNKIDYRASISGNKKIIENKWTIRTTSSTGKKLVVLKTTETADELYQKGNLEQAVETFINCLKLTPEAKEIYYELTRIFIESKNFPKAWEVIESMLDAVKNTLKGLEYAGYTKEGLGMDDEAATYADKMLAINRQYPAALNLRGALAYKKGEKEKAADYFRKAIDSDPGYADAYTNLGVLCFSMDKKDEALVHLRRGFILSPTVPDINSLYYSVVSSLGTFDVAEDNFREACSLYPHNKNLAFLYIDTLIHQGKFAEALLMIEDALLLFGIDDGTLAAALSVREKIGALSIKKGSKKITLSLCMIVKNEEKFLVNCLKSIRDIVDEMIVVDTGSTDRTKDIATAFGAQVFDFPWTGDFSTARNYSLEQANCDWILILDADEVISNLDHKRLLKIIDKGKQKSVAFDIVTRNYLGKSGAAGWMENDGSYPQEEKGIGWYASNKVRLFRNNGLVRFENPIHELLEASLNQAGIPIEKCTIPIHHYGRLDHDKVLAKGLDYYQLGRKKLEERGGGDYTSLRELAIQACEIGKFEDAIDLWKQALALRPDTVEALFNLAYNYIQLGKYQDALQASKRAVELSPKTKDAVLNYALCEMLMGNVTKTITLLEGYFSDENENPTLMGVLGVSYFIKGDIDQGVAIFTKLTKKHRNIFDYVNSLLEKLIASGRIEYARLLTTALICNNVADHNTLRLQMTPVLNKIVKRLQTQGKQDDALLVFNMITENKINDSETQSLIGEPANKDL